MSIDQLRLSGIATSQIGATDKIKTSVIVKQVSYIERPEPTEEKVDNSLRALIRNKRNLRNLLVFAGLWVVGTFNSFMIFF